MRAGAALPWLLVGTACIHFDRDSGAPGLADVARPPDAPGLRLVEPAQRPGETLVLLTPGVFLLGGARGLGHDLRGMGTYGAELSLEWGTRADNHDDDGELPRRGWRPDVVLPDRGWGLTLAGHFFDGPEVGPISLELRRRLSDLSLIGLGPSYQPTNHQAGALASAQWGPFLLRAGYAREGGFVGAGLDLFYPMAWVRTR